MDLNKISVVLDPCARHAGLRTALEATDWIEVELKNDWVTKALECEGRRGFLHRSLDKEAHTDTTWVRIYQTVSSLMNGVSCKQSKKPNKQLLTIKHFESKFQVNYKSWQAHKECMLQPCGWASYVAQWHCFVGGPDVGLDLGYVSTLLSVDHCYTDVVSKGTVRFQDRRGKSVPQCHAHTFECYASVATSSRAHRCQKQIHSSNPAGFPCNFFRYARPSMDEAGEPATCAKGNKKRVVGSEEESERQRGAYKASTGP